MSVVRNREEIRGMIIAVVGATVVVALLLLALGANPWEAFKFLVEALVGIGGAAFSLDKKFGWSEGHVRNFGWIALVIVMFGGWHPIRVALGCYLFGGLQVVALKLQPVFPGLSQVLPILLFPMMILTLVVINRPGFGALGDRYASLWNFLASEPPAALGTNFEQQ